MAKSNKNKAGLRPIGDNVLVKPIEEKVKEKKSESGIILPESSEKDDIKKGEVVATGKGNFNENGELTPLSVKEGDKVMFKEFAGDEVKIKGEEYQILSERSILGILE